MPDYSAVLRITYAGRVIHNPPIREAALASIQDHSGQTKFNVSNATFGFDPWPGHKKHCEVIFRHSDGRDTTYGNEEGDKMILGKSYRDAKTRTLRRCGEQAHDGVLAVLKVVWGGQEILAPDVLRAAHMSLMDHWGRRIGVPATNDAMGGDPLVGQAKTLKITVRRINGAVETLSAPEGHTLYLGRESDSNVE